MIGPLGARVDGPDVRLRVWAPHARSVRVRVGDWVTDLAGPDAGHFEGTWPRDRGRRYELSLDAGPWRPDPVSRALPEGVHGVSEVATDLDPPAAWTGRSFEELVFYELHVGTFTPEGTFDAAARDLPRLVELGVSAIELMPLAEVPGAPPRNWGYDGVQHYTVRRDYGGAEGLHRFVAVAHQLGLAVFEDVVYNHLGPEGNYLHGFAPYFTQAYRTPWGEAFNLDGPGSDGVRTYFLEHARERFRRFGLDGLRLDSCPNLYDRSAYPFLEELSAMVDALSVELGRPLHLVAEADDNDPRWVRPRREQGLGLHGVWMDDLHHAVHGLFSAEKRGYYVDYGSVGPVAKAFVHGAYLRGTYSAFRQRRWGHPTDLVPVQNRVVYVQNHDLVGNRGDGARAVELYAPAAHGVALALGLFAPGQPLLFMGQEYGERRPFWFFSSFEDPRVAGNVRRGRPAMFAAFGGSDRTPDPQDPATRLACVLDRARTETEEGRAITRLHSEALALKGHLGPVQDLRCDSGQGFEVQYAQYCLRMGLDGERFRGGPRVFDSWAYLSPDHSRSGPRLVVDPL